MGKLRAHELTKRSKSDLEGQLEELKKELAQLRVAQHLGGTAASKLAKIKVVRKNIARVLTVYNQTQKAALRVQYKNAKYMPLDLRPKKTRAIRRRLTTAQLTKKTVRVQKREANFPRRRYALKA
ncbi:ribosomal L29 protein-domain-containing protein [Tribonema minus]|uniref:Ribosomal L29 protein-domain-containing protein n=1 Tax=Tribonema minus TaxID=303371 RepID=A0A835ZB13_9STRA|nr:ribosomal L29 protein-domain-containing protein [Tribonema minus]